MPRFGFERSKVEKATSLRDPVSATIRVFPAVWRIVAVQSVWWGKRGSNALGVVRPWLRGEFAQSGCHPTQPGHTGHMEN